MKLGAYIERLTEQPLLPETVRDRETFQFALERKEILSGERGGGSWVFTVPGVLSKWL